MEDSDKKPLLTTQHQENMPKNNQISKTNIQLANLEILEMLKKGATPTVQNQKEKGFLSKKRDGGHRPVRNLNELN